MDTNENNINVNKNNLDTNSDYIYGRNAVYEAIASGVEIRKIYFCYGIADLRITAISKERKIKITTLDKNKFKVLESRACPPNSKTQGIIALKEIIKTYDFFDFFAELDISSNPIIAILNEIKDPHNLGAIARNAECAGVSALILPNNKSAPITSTAIKTSSGALSYLPVIQVQNVIYTIERLKELGFWIFGTDLNGTENYSNKKLYDKPTVIIIGSEDKGISPSIIKHCDYLIKIPMYGKINSLNASVAAGIVFFEIQRNRQEI